MIIVDGDKGEIVQANTAAYELFGPPLVGATLDRLVPEPLRQAHNDHRSTYMRLPVARPMSLGVEVHATVKDRDAIPVVIGLTPIPSTRLIIAEIDPQQDSH